MIHHSISLIYTTARPHLINTIIDRWLLNSDKDIEMIIVTDEPFANNNSDSNIRFFVNTGRRDCVTGWNLAAKNSTGEILIQVSDDLFPPDNYYQLIRSLIKQFSLERSDVVLNLLDERRKKNAVFHPVLTRSAFEKLPYLYPPDFESMFCDNWFCSFHKKNSMYVTSDQVFWNHFHRTTHDVEKDEVMFRHESPERYKRGRQIFFKYIKEQGLDKL